MSKPIKDQIVEIIQSAVGKNEPVVLAEPPRPEMGDYSFPCFDLAKSSGGDPVAAANELVIKVKGTRDKVKVIKEVVAMGPYVNFFIEPAALVEEVLTRNQEIKKSRNHLISSCP